MEETKREEIKMQILQALCHQEAEDGLYLRNFFHLHEEDERPAVIAEEEDIVEALNDLIELGMIRTERDPAGMVFVLKEQHRENLIN